MKLQSKNKLDLMMDLGSERTRMYNAKNEVVLDEPTRIAINPGSQKVLFAGEDLTLIPRQKTRQIQLVNPIQNGVLHDFELTVALLKYWRKKRSLSSLFRRPRVGVIVDPYLRDVYKRGIRDCVTLAGFNVETFIEAPLVTTG